jgi:diguanylate cyclase (GGDEF)-like protein
LQRYQQQPVKQDSGQSTLHDRIATPEILERLACLTRIRDLEGIELNLLHVLQELFQPEHILVFALDRRSTVRVAKRYLGAHEVVDITHGQLSACDWAQRSEQLIRTAMTERKAQRRSEESGACTLAYPLLAADPWNVGLTMTFRRCDAIPHAEVLETLLQIYRNFCSLMDDSQRDQLTGLLNRKTFDDNIQRVLMRTQSYASERTENERRRPKHAVDGQNRATEERFGHWLGIIDIDHFKRINDTHGHLHGDEVLLLVAQILRTTFRDTDLIYRFGGEEFVVVLSSADGPSSSDAFDRLREAVEARNFPQVGHISVSFGATEITPHCNAHILLDRADQALYYAKQNGRNQGHLYEDLADNGLVAPVVQKYGDMELF